MIAHETRGQWTLATCLKTGGGVAIENINKCAIKRRLRHLYLKSPKCRTRIAV